MVRGRFRLLRAERGYAIFELLVVMLILGVVLAGIGQLFVSATVSQADLTHRFDAQQDARIALDRIRREAHCASAVAAPAPPGVTGVVLTLPAWCNTGTGEVTWCVSGSASPYGLHRITGNAAACSGGQTFSTDLTSSAVFDLSKASTVAPASIPAGDLPKLGVSITVDTTPTNSTGQYRLIDDIVLRNAARNI